MRLLRQTKAQRDELIDGNVEQSGGAQIQPNLNEKRIKISFQLHQIAFKLTVFKQRANVERSSTLSNAVNI